MVTLADSPPAPVPPAVPDAPPGTHRGVHRTKPVLRGWMHLLWFEVSLVAGTLLLVHVRGTARFSAAAVYAASVSALFGASALYHRGNWGPVWQRRFQRLDQSMIFLLIAGTATPVFLLAAPDAFGLTCLAVLWALTLAATAARMTGLKAVERLLVATFVGLSGVAGLALPAVWIRDGVEPGTLMIAGCLLYIAGAVSFHRRRPDPLPSVFGYHEVFHAYVCAAAACQFAAIALLVA